MLKTFTWHLINVHDTLSIGSSLMFYPRQHHIVVIREMLSYCVSSRGYKSKYRSKVIFTISYALERKFYFNFSTMIWLGSNYLWVCPLSFWLFIILTSQFKFYLLYYIFLKFGTK